MRVEDAFYFGRIVRKHSYKGEVVVKIEPDFAHLTTELESVWLLLKNQLVPFFMENILPTGEVFFRIQFEGIDSEADADSLIGVELMLPLSYLPKTKGTDFFKHEIIDFQVVDVNFGSVGPVVHINDATPQVLLEVAYGKKIVFIPVHDNFIKKIDKKNKTITVETPEGLFDL